MLDGPIVLTGANGLLGGAFAGALAGKNLVRLGREQLGSQAPGTVARLVSGLEPTLVINCAADTDVEGAETAPERAFAVNATLAEAVARGAAQSGAPMLHFSSTGCYGDWKTTPYTEDDELRPTTVHHRSKAVGEEMVLRAHPDALVLRLGWVFGGVAGQRKNFVWARLVEAHGNEEIISNPAQVGCPTSATDTVAQSLVLLRARASGVFNCVGAGPAASRLDYVVAIMAAAGRNIRVMPRVAARRAPVSANESAVNDRLDRIQLGTMPPWRTSLAQFVKALQDKAAERGGLP